MAQGHDELGLIAELLWRDGAATVDDAVRWYRREWNVPDDQDVERPVEAEAQILVDASPVRFRVLRRTESWLANAELPRVCITIAGDHVDIGEVALVTVTDLRPYIDGTRALRRPSRRRRRPPRSR